MSLHETGLVLGGVLGGFLFGLLSCFAFYYFFVREQDDFKDKISVGVFVCVGFFALFQSVMLNIFLTSNL